jgi:NAD(P)-dependent dehydrogenase (short-subunit alcohol dehydrogenase family)
MNKLDDKIAIVTGGGKGIGRAISLRFASEGAKVAIWEKDLDAAEETSKQISESGGMAIPIECEISDKNSVSNALQKTLNELGTPTHLVNNAGIAHVGTATTTTEEDFDRVMNVNTKGLFLCLQYW